jgi:hypothetical protein
LAVSQENIEHHRRVVDAFNARDVESYVPYFDPSIELHSAFAAVGGAIYHGHDGLQKWHRDLSDVFGDEIHFEVDAYFDLGEETLAFYALQGQGPKRC